MRPRQPCRQDCPDRCEGCARACEKWQAYVIERDKDYELRNAASIHGPAIEKATAGKLRRIKYRGRR